MCMCFYWLCRDTCRAVAFITTFIGAALMYSSVKVLHPLWYPYDEIELLSDAWFPCFIFFMGTMLFIVGFMATFGSCNSYATAPLHVVSSIFFIISREIY